MAAGQTLLPYHKRNQRHDEAELLSSGEIEVVRVVPSVPPPSSGPQSSGHSVKSSELFPRVPRPTVPASSRARAQRGRAHDAHAAEVVAVHREPRRAVSLRRPARRASRPGVLASGMDGLDDESTRLRPNPVARNGRDLIGELPLVGEHGRHERRAAVRTARARTRSRRAPLPPPSMRGPRSRADEHAPDLDVAALVAWPPRFVAAAHGEPREPRETKSSRSTALSFAPPPNMQPSMALGRTQPAADNMAPPAAVSHAGVRASVCAVAGARPWRPSRSATARRRPARSPSARSPKAGWTSPATVITTRTKVLIGRPTISWAAALVAMGIFVGLVTAVVARGDADTLIDATAGFVDPTCTAVLRPFGAGSSPAPARPRGADARGETRRSTRSTRSTRLPARRSRTPLRFLRRPRSRPRSARPAAPRRSRTPRGDRSALHPPATLRRPVAAAPAWHTKTEAKADERARRCRRAICRRRATSLPRRTPAPAPRVVHRYVAPRHVAPPPPAADKGGRRSGEAFAPAVTGKKSGGGSSKGDDDVNEMAKKQLEQSLSL